MSKGPTAALELQPSEAHVLAAASRLLAARIAAGQAAGEEAIEQCARQAIQLAIRVDRLLQAEGEHSGEGTWKAEEFRS